MAPTANFPLLEDPGELALFQGWTRDVYVDLLALERGELLPSDFDAKYRTRKAVLVLDITGFTVNAMRGGAINSFLRILDTHKICFPVFEEYAATQIRAFADDVAAVFDEAGPALAAALEIHRRVDLHNRSSDTHEHPPECCIGIGYGDVYEIGPNLSMGDEMNRASVLGEDIARGGETLVTEGAYAALADLDETKVERQFSDDMLFPYYRVTRAA